MALTGVHVACGYTHNPGSSRLSGRIAWSETLANPGMTDHAAPANREPDLGRGTSWSAFEVSAGVDAFISIGPSPDAAAGPRVLVRAGESRAVFCAPGDRLAWAAA